MNNITDTFSERLRQLRTAKGLTQAELADELGVSRNSIFFYEAGKRNPDIVIFKKIADYFHVTCDYMLGASINKTVETREIGEELGLTDEAISTLKQQSKEAKGDFEARMYTTAINRIIVNKKLVFEIASFIDKNFKSNIADFIARDTHDDVAESSKKQTFENIGIPYTEENRKLISEFLYDTMDEQIMRRIHDELELIRGEATNNADQKD